MSISAKEIYSMRLKYANKNIFILGSAPSIKKENLKYGKYKKGE